jgi:hypothetical protein
VTIFTRSRCAALARSKSSSATPNASGAAPHSNSGTAR